VRAERRKRKPPQMSWGALLVLASMRGRLPSVTTPTSHVLLPSPHCRRCLHRRRRRRRRRLAATSGGRGRRRSHGEPTSPPSRASPRPTSELPSLPCPAIQPATVTRRSIMRPSLTQPACAGRLSSATVRWERAARRREEGSEPSWLRTFMKLLSESLSHVALISRVDGCALYVCPYQQGQVE
jgi:hypothetical protein